MLVSPGKPKFVRTDCRPVPRKPYPADVCSRDGPMRGISRMPPGRRWRLMRKLAFLLFTPFRPWRSPAIIQRPARSLHPRGPPPIGAGREPQPPLPQSRGTAVEADRRDAGRFPEPGVGVRDRGGRPLRIPGKRSLSELSVSQTIQNPLARHYRLGAMEIGGRRRRGACPSRGPWRWTTRSGSTSIRILYLQEHLRLARLNEEALDEIRGLIETRARAGRCGSWRPSACGSST